jgi:thiamine transport system permease protein
MALALRGSELAGIAGALPLASSPLVLGAGLLLALRAVATPESLALPVTALVDGLLALPFALRVLAAPLAEIEARHGRLAQSLGIAGARRLRIVILPLLRPSLGFAAGLAAALSVGNLGVVALFAGEGGATLPLLMSRLMGAYRLEAAAGVGLVTLALALLLFWSFDRWGAGRAGA